MTHFKSPVDALRTILVHTNGPRHIINAAAELISQALGNDQTATVREQAVRIRDLEQQLLDAQAVAPEAPATPEAAVVKTRKPKKQDATDDEGSST